MGERGKSRNTSENGHRKKQQHSFSLPHPILCKHIRSPVGYPVVYRTQYHSTECPLWPRDAECVFNTTHAHFQYIVNQVTPFFKGHKMYKKKTTTLKWVMSKFFIRRTAIKLFGNLSTELKYFSILESSHTADTTTKCQFYWERRLSFSWTD